MLSKNVRMLRITVMSTTIVLLDAKSVIRLLKKLVIVLSVTVRPLRISV